MKSIKRNIIKLIAGLTLTLMGISISQNTVKSETNLQTVQAAKKLSKKERAAKKWIANKESGGNYKARNGVCYGKYQLNISYLKGNFSKKNQEKVADNYVYSRYGSWVKAKKFWKIHHWY